MVSLSYLFGQCSMVTAQYQFAFSRERNDQNLNESFQVITDCGMWRWIVNIIIP